MKRLLVYLKAYRKECVIAPLFKLLEAAFELLVPLVVAKIIDVGIVNSDGPYVLKMGFCLIALAIVGLSCSVTAQFFAAKAAVGPEILTLLPPRSAITKPATIAV